jgi:hypothetical protein
VSFIQRSCFFLKNTFTYTMDPQQTGFSDPAFAAPSPGHHEPTMLPEDACQEHITDSSAAAAPYVEVGGAELMAAPVMGGGSPAEDSAPTEYQRDEAGDVGEDLVRGSQEKTPTHKKHDSHGRTVVKADTPTVTICKGKGQYSAPWSSLV